MIKENLTKIKETVEGSVLLVAVSKTKPIEDIIEAYAAGQFDFGENYIQELVSKSQALKSSCPDIKWHFIGALQSNKIALLLKEVPGLASIQTVDSLEKLKKITKIVSSSLSELNDSCSCDVIDLFLQVNVSGEDSKHGMKEVEEIVECYNYFHSINLNGCCCLKGLMMIGESSASLRDFTRLTEIKKQVSSCVDWTDMKLSMGMSDDYELAIKMGSDLVRIGSAIFGSRSRNS